MDGILAGTSSELQPGTGGSGAHPAPAAVLGDDGQLHVAGEPPSGWSAGTSSPVGDTFDVQGGGGGQFGDVTDPVAIAKLKAIVEPTQIDTDRPDLGTP